MALSLLALFAEGAAAADDLLQRVRPEKRFEVAAWRQADQYAPSRMTTRIELQFAPPRSQFGEFGAVGVELSDDSKLSMKLRRGGPMVYYRARF